MKICPNCGHVFSPKIKICPDCGTLLVEQGEDPNRGFYKKRPLVITMACLILALAGFGSYLLYREPLISVLLVYFLIGAALEIPLIIIVAQRPTNAKPLGICALITSVLSFGLICLSMIYSLIAEMSASIDYVKALAQGAAFDFAAFSSTVGICLIVILSFIFSLISVGALAKGLASIKDPLPLASVAPISSPNGGQVAPSGVAEPTNLPKTEAALKQGAASMATSVSEPQSAATKESSYFDGGLLSLFGRTIVNVLLLIITIGLAFPWVYCRNVRWRDSHTVVDGYRVKFEGKGGQIFGHWLLWLLLFVVTIGIYGFWIPCKIRDFEARNSRLVPDWE